MECDVAPFRRSLCSWRLACLFPRSPGCGKCAESARITACDVCPWGNSWSPSRRRTSRRRSNYHPRSSPFWRDLSTFPAGTRRSGPSFRFPRPEIV